MRRLGAHLGRLTAISVVTRVVVASITEVRGVGVLSVPGRTRATLARSTPAPTLPLPRRRTLRRRPLG
jgi:hypothetical protein